MAADDTTAGLAKSAWEKPLSVFDAHSAAAKMPEFRWRKGSQRWPRSRSAAAFPASRQIGAFPN